VLTQCLPDGLGDIVFGESAVRELLEIPGLEIAWVRCYSNAESREAGEHLVAETIRLATFSLAICKDGLREAIMDPSFIESWTSADERFLSPWIFGLSQHDDVLLVLAAQAETHFWATTEYGRGMGNIHTYTQGFGSKVQTGWALGGSGGVFRSIRKKTPTETDWRLFFANRCGVPESENVRLWWFYSRKDDEKKHDFRILDETAPRLPGAVALASETLRILAASKVVPVGLDGNISVGDEKTSGEKLAEQAFKAANDPNFKPNTDVASQEVATGSAGQLSQFLWGLLYDSAYTSGCERGPGDPIDIIVAPNILTPLRCEEMSGSETSAVVRLLQLDLVATGKPVNEKRLEGRSVFICNARVPREEMRTFLEQCEERVFTTGDQSLAEAIFLGKFPCIKPDAKVQQWQLALVARQNNLIDHVGDLGAEMRNLVLHESSRENARRSSKRFSEEVETSMIAQLGGPPSTWNPTHHVLARAGMLG